MDRLVRVDIKELELTFRQGERCTGNFRLTNLMHTMSVAVSLTNTDPSLFSFNKALSILPPLSSSTFFLFLTQPSHRPPLSSPPDTIVVRTSMLPTGKAHAEDLRHLFSRPGPHVFKDAIIPISFVGHHVVEFLLSPPPPSNKTLEIAVLLSKAIPGCSSSQLTSLLRPAARSGNPNFVSTLIEAGADINDRNPNELSVMSLAVCSGNSDVVKVLIRSGYIIDDSVDRNLLHDAAASNSVELMEVLCREVGELDFNSVDSIGRTPVHVSAIHGHIDVLRFCVSMGGDPDRVDSNGWTPLHCASAEGHLEAVEFLLNCSLYSKDAMTKDGKTAFSLAVDGGHSHLLELLRFGDLLHRAARLDDVHGMKSCLAQGAKVNERDQNGWTPLHRAAFKGRIECAKLLLNHGAQIDLVDDAGYTPLHCAIEAGHTQVALYLIAHGARANAKCLKEVCLSKLDSLKNHGALVFPLCCEKERT